MNSAISSVVKAQSSNPASANKSESETAKSAERVTGGLNTADESSVSSKFDTVDLSKDYIEYKTQSQNSSIEDQTSQQNSTMIRILSGSKDKETIYSYELYAYTEDELLDLMNDGRISFKEYEEEIASRDPVFLKSVTQ